MTNLDKFQKYSLYHKDDIAVMPCESEDTIEKYLSLDDNDMLSSKGIVCLSLMNDIKVGDAVYFDPRGVCFIEDLGVFVMNYKNILVKECDLNG